MKTFFVLGLLSFGAVVSYAQEKKDAIVILTPEGQRVEIKVPHDIVTVKQTGPNTQEVTVNKEAQKKIEVRVLPPTKK